MMTARYWFRTRKHDPAVLVVSRSRSLCEGEEGSKDGEGKRAGLERYAWSEKYQRWQMFEGMRPDAYLVVAATDWERERLVKAARTLKRRKLRKRVRLGRSYPRILQTDDVPGLEAGSYALVLGMCEDPSRAQEAVRWLRRKLRGKGFSYRVRGILREGAPRLQVVCPRPR
jgi:hypothetical protein